MHIGSGSPTGQVTTAGRTLHTPHIVVPTGQGEGSSSLTALRLRDLDQPCVVIRPDLILPGLPSQGERRLSGSGHRASLLTGFLCTVEHLGMLQPQLRHRERVHRCAPVPT